MNEMMIKENEKVIVDPVTNNQIDINSFNGDLFSHLQDNPDVWLRSTSFDGLGRRVETSELIGKKVYFFDCEVIDYDLIDKKSLESKHFHYSAWRGILEESGESIVYLGGTKLTKLADDLVLPENANILEAVRNKGAHLYFPPMKDLGGGRQFCNPDLIP